MTCEAQGYLEPKDQHKCECHRKILCLTPLVKGDASVRYYVCAKCDSPLDAAWSFCPYCCTELDWSNKP